MLQNAYLLAKIGAHTAENEQHFAEILPKTGKLSEDGVDFTSPGPHRRRHGRGSAGAAGVDRLRAGAHPRPNAAFLRQTPAFFIAARATSATEDASFPPNLLT